MNSLFYKTKKKKQDIRSIIISLLFFKPILLNISLILKLLMKFIKKQHLNYIIYHSHHKLKKLKVNLLKLL